MSVPSGSRYRRYWAVRRTPYSGPRGGAGRSQDHLRPRLARLPPASFCLRNGRPLLNATKSKGGHALMLRARMTLPHFSGEPRRARPDCLRPHRTTRLLVIELLKRYFQGGNQSAASSLNPTSDAKAIRGPPATLQSDRDLSTRTHSLKPPTTPRISFRLLWNATHVQSLRRRRVEKPQ